MTTSEWKYELGVAHPLPDIDLSQSILATWTSETSNKRWSRWITLHFARFVVIYRVSALLVVVCWLVGDQFLTRQNRFLIVLLLVPAIPVFGASFVLLNRTILGILSRQFEFWFASILNLSTFLLLGHVLGDLRAILILVVVPGAQLIVCFDANFQTLVSAIKTGFLLMPLELGIAYICLRRGLHDAMKTSSSGGLNAYQERLVDQFTTTNTLLNVSTTLIIFVANKIYKRRIVFRKRFLVTRMVPLTIYRARLVLIRCTNKTPPPPV